MEDTSEDCTFTLPPALPMVIRKFTLFTEALMVKGSAHIHHNIVG